MKYLIFGITGQDGGYLASKLIKKGDEVIGVRRPSSSDNSQRLRDIFKYENEDLAKLKIIHGDLIDGGSVNDLVINNKPDAIVNFAAQSHVGISFDLPELTANIDALGCLRILEAVRKYHPKCKFYQASTSELFGGKDKFPLDENSNFNPRSPYAVAKMYSYWLTKQYRSAYNLHASNGILFNHESPFRGEHFVTQKIVTALVSIKKGSSEILKLGNIDSKRDWGHAKDFVDAVEMIISADDPDDYVVATGKAYSVREFIGIVLEILEMKGKWKKNKEGLEQFFCTNLSNNEKLIITQDEKYFRPSEVEHLLGNPSKINKQLGWFNKISLEQLAKEMIDYQLAS